MTTKTAWWKYRPLPPAAPRKPTGDDWVTAAFLFVLYMVLIIVGGLTAIRIALKLFVWAWS